MAEEGMTVTTYQKTLNKLIDEIARLQSQKRLLRFRAAMIRHERPDLAPILNELLLLLEDPPKDSPKAPVPGSIVTSV